MKFTIAIKDTSSSFYKACSSNGQAMGMAIPFILEETGLFSLTYNESGKPIVVDRSGNTYKTHFSQGKKFHISPSYQKGFGRQYNKIKAELSVCEYDYHLFINKKDTDLIIGVMHTKDVYYEMNKENGEIIVELS